LIITVYIYYRKLDGKAAERAKIVDDFIQRKRDAALNKQRGIIDVFGVSCNQRDYCSCICFTVLSLIIKYFD